MRIFESFNLIITNTTFSIYITGVMGTSAYDANEWEEVTVETADIGTAPSAVTSNIDVPNYVAVVPSPPINTQQAKSADIKPDGPQSSQCAAAVSNNNQQPNYFLGQPNSQSMPTLKASSPLSRRAGIKHNNIVEKNKQERQDEQAERRARMRDDKRRVLLEKRAAFESLKAQGLPLDAESSIGSCFGKQSTEDINQLDFEDSDSDLWTQNISTVGN